MASATAEQGPEAYAGRKAAAAMSIWNRRALLVIATAAVTVAGPVVGAQRPNDLQSRFDHETNSVHKAKIFEHLGDQQFSEARHASQTRDYKAVAEIMEIYRNNARTVFNALKKEHPNAERQLSGYKQLQIHIHKSIREVDESLLVSPPEFKPPLMLVRQDLSSMDDELLVMIFPRRPTERKADAPPPALIAPPPEGMPDKTETVTEPKPDERADETTQETPLAEKPFEKSEMPDMNIKNCVITVAVACTLGSADCGPAQARQKDYLSSLESDKIRDAETTNDRIKLFLTFADDRLKKFQYELQHPSSNKHPEMLNALMNGYVGCVDDAADLVQLGIEKQENVRAGIDLMVTRTKEFLDVLNKVSEDKIEIDIYKDNLNDAIEGTRDALNDAEKAKKNVAPPPVRRRG
jgi:hypothetical protein